MREKSDRSSDDKRKRNARMKKQIKRERKEAALYKAIAQTKAAAEKTLNYCVPFAL